MRELKGHKRRTQVACFAAAVLLFSACIDEPSNSNQGNLARQTPTPSPNAESSVSTSPTQNISSPTPTPAQLGQEPPFPTPSAGSPQPTEPKQTTGAVVLSSDALMIPVFGVKKSELQDTFTASRSEGRSHDSIDIMAKEGTPVVATADGEIARFFDSVKGGITIYQRSADKKLMYYYAHLQRRADGIQPGQFVKQGTVIGYVGDTGNSGAGNFHLHFSIWTIDDPKRDWDGTNHNPFPLLQNGVEKLY